MKHGDLFTLIKALSPAEKRHFRLHCQAQGAQSAYVSVFNAIDKLTEYDEAALKAQFKNQKFVRQFHVIKNYLHKSIMKSLRSFHGASSKEAQLKDLLRNVEIFFFKELYHHAQRELSKAERLASHFEIHSGQLEVLGWQRRLQQHGAPQNLEALRDIGQKEQETIHLLQNKLDYMRLIVEVSSAVQSGEHEPVENEALLNTPANARSLDARVMHYNALYFRSVQKQNTAESEETLYQLLDYLESNPRRLHEDPGFYVSSVNNFLSYMVFQGRKEEAFELLARAKKVYERVTIASEKRTLLKQMLRTYNIELELYRDSGEYEMHREFIGHLEEFVSKNERKMPEEYLLSFNYQFAYIKFQVLDFKGALAWVNRILNTKWHNPRLDVLMHTRFLNLMIHTELNNLFVLRYFVDNTRRFLKKNSLLNTRTQHLIKLFSGLGKAPLLERKTIFAQALQTTPADPPGSGSPVDDWSVYDNWIKRNSGHVKSVDLN